MTKATMQVVNLADSDDPTAIGFDTVLADARMIAKAVGANPYQVQRYTTGVYFVHIFNKEGRAPFTLQMKPVKGGGFKLKVELNDVMKSLGEPAKLEAYRQKVRKESSKGKKRSKTPV